MFTGNLPSPYSTQGYGARCELLYLELLGSRSIKLILAFLFDP